MIMKLRLSFKLQKEKLDTETFFKANFFLFGFLLKQIAFFEKLGIMFISVILRLR